MSTSSNPSRRTIPMRSRWPGTAGKQYSLHEIRVPVTGHAPLAHVRRAVPLPTGLTADHVVGLASVDCEP